MLCVADWCGHSGEEVQKVVASMEKVVAKRSGRLAVTAFRVLESMYHKDDYTQLTSEMLNEDQKPTVTRLKEIADTIIRRRHWTWLLQHPDLDVSHIHESRRVLFAPCFACLMWSHDDDMHREYTGGFRHGGLCYSEACSPSLPLLLLFAIANNMVRIVSCFVVGTLAEVPALEAALLHRDHAKVSLSGTRWTWSASTPFPPLDAVLKTPIWSSDRYAQVRHRLRQPVPTPVVKVGGRYVTIDLTAPTKKVVSEAGAGQSSRL